MIPVYICDDEQSVRQKIAKILSEQIMILDQDLGPVCTLEDPQELLLQQKENACRLLS